jgi:O-antigen/teichoic acid export membrane protein
MLITNADVIWNYAATFLKIAASALLLPFILRMMPAEMVGIWTVFMAITTFSILLDFGFNPSFARNITYIFSGVRLLKVNGFDVVDTKNSSVDYGLLKGTIIAMKWFYSKAGLVLFFLLATLGTYYIYTLLQNYKGDHKEVYIAWTVLCLINSYNIYTLYYESLLQGKGLVKKTKQIVIVGQTVYLLIGTVLIMAGSGLIAIVSAQASSVLIIRWLSHHYFFTNEIKEKLHDSIPRPKKEILNAITPNAVKIGLTAIGGFMVQKSALVIGSLYLPLENIASYGVTLQIIAVIAGLSGIYTFTYQPKITQLRIAQDVKKIKEHYIKGQIILFITYVIGGIVLLSCGSFVLNLIGSQTHLMNQLLTFTAIVLSFFESNHSIAGTILLTKNEVPFFKAALFSGAATVIILLIFFHFTYFGLWAMVISQGLAQAAYQNWKWPLTVIDELKIKRQDISEIVEKMFHYK